MTSNAMLLFYVLSAIAPLYEDFTGIKAKVAEWSSDDGVHFEDNEIRNCLRESIKAELIHVWTLATSARENRRVDFLPESFEGFWFLISDQGEHLLKSKSLNG